MHHILNLSEVQITVSDLFGLHAHNMLMCSTFLSEVHGLPGDLAVRFLSTSKAFTNQLAITNFDEVLHWT
jgi:hypothetical protein